MWSFIWTTLFTPATNKVKVISSMEDCSSECCQHPYVIFDAAGLRQGFIESIYGQDVALKTISQALWAHKRNFGDAGPTKPLVMSFHGAPGTGKNHVVNIIMKHLFKKNTRSKFIHTWTGGRNLNLKGDHMKILVRTFTGLITQIH